MDGSPAQTLALAVGIGSFVTMVCMRLGIPAILPLLLVGVGVGESGLGLIHTDQLGGGLVALITVSVALLIFEGSLALDRRGLAHSPRAVRGLLTIGVVVTWGLGSLAAKYILGVDWSIAILLASMLIVTGPTVVQPILRRVPLKSNLHAALMAEGVLIDPIGAVIAVATLEVVRAGLEGNSGSPWHIAWTYVGPLVVGLAIGAAFGFAGGWLMRRDEQRSVSYARGGRLALIGMGACMGAVGLAELVARESGLAAAAAAGVVIANARLEGAEELRRFKEQISTFLVGTLFLLLAARFDLLQVRDIGVREVLFIVAMIALVRPVSVALSTWGTVLTYRERVFASFFAPRGIVAASLASIVALEFARIAGTLDAQVALASQDTASLLPQDQALAEAAATQAQNLADAGRLIETTVFLVIFATVALGGTFSGLLATVLKIRAGEPNGVLIVGGQRLGRDLAVALSKLGVHVRLVDTNAGNIAAASSWGIPTHLGDATDPSWLAGEVPMERIGWVFACTDNDTVDQVVARWAEQALSKDRAFRWWSKKPGENAPGLPTIQYGRPLRHLLFQMDIDVARVETWQGEREGGLPFAVVRDEKVRLIEDGEKVPDEEGTQIVGVVVGPRLQDEHGHAETS